VITDLSPTRLCVDGHLPGDHSLGNLSLPDYADSEKGKARYRKPGIPDCVCQLADFIGEAEVERIYGVGEIKADDPFHKLSQRRPAKWEDRPDSLEG
jgi:hypothetical protein